MMDLPYNLNELTWDDEHLTNEQSQYCYCGQDKTRLGNNEMYQCLKCKQWFHHGCLKTECNFLLYGDRWVEFTCALCGPLGAEVFEYGVTSWRVATFRVFKHLSIRRFCEKGNFDDVFFHGSDIKGFMDEMWHAVRYGQQRTPTWQNTVSSELSINISTFQSGVEVLGLKGFWALRELVSNPGLTAAEAFKLQPSRSKPNASLTREPLEMRQLSESPGGSINRVAQTPDIEETPTKRRRIRRKSFDGAEGVSSEQTKRASREKKATVQEWSINEVQSQKSDFRVLFGQLIPAPSAAKHKSIWDQLPGLSRGLGRNARRCFRLMKAHSTAAYPVSLAGPGIRPVERKSSIAPMAQPAEASPSCLPPSEHQYTQVAQPPEPIEAWGCNDSHVKKRRKNHASLSDFPSTKVKKVAPFQSGNESRSFDLVNKTQPSPKHVPKRKTNEFNGVKQSHQASLGHKTPPYNPSGLKGRNSFQEWELLQRLSNSSVALTPVAQRLKRKLAMNRQKDALGIPRFNLDQSINQYLQSCDLKIQPCLPPPESTAELTPTYMENQSKKPKNATESSCESIQDKSTSSSEVRVTPWEKSFASRLYGATLSSRCAKPRSLSRISPYHGTELLPLIWQIKALPKYKWPVRLGLLMSLKQERLSLSSAKDSPKEPTKKFRVPTRHKPITVADREIKPLPMPIDFCYIEAHHLPQVNQLLSRLFWTGINMQEALHYPDYGIVVMYGNLVIGCAFMTPSHYITYLAIAPGWQNSGLGTKLLYLLIQKSKGHDITLHVSTNNPALILYQAFGFKAERFLVNFYDKYIHPNSAMHRNALFYRLRQT